MAWSIEYDPRALKDLKELDRAAQREILDYIDGLIADAADPRDFGKPLRKSKFGLWRYRVRDYRILCEIQESQLVVLVVAVGISARFTTTERGDSYGAPRNRRISRVRRSPWSVAKIACA